MKSYRPEELFDESGRFRDELAALAPTGHRRMSANPHANGGALLQPLSMPHFRDYGVAVPSPGSVEAEATRNLGKYLRDVIKLNLDKRNFRLFGPDETASNRLEAVYEVTAKQWMARIEAVDVNLAVEGRASCRSPASSAARASSATGFAACRASRSWIGSARCHRIGW